MALKNTGEPEAFAELTVTAKKEMEAIAVALERSEADIKALEDIGIMQPKLKEMVEMGKKMHKVVSARFT